MQPSKLRDRGDCSSVSSETAVRIADALSDAPRAAGRRLRMLVVSSDRYPPRRVDVKVLFGEELAGRGHHIDWILQSEAECPRAYTTPWGGGQVWVGPTDLGSSLIRRMRKHARGIRNDWRLFELLRRGRYDLIEVKDKFVSGLLAMLAARWCGARFVYWLSWPFPEDYLIRAREGTARYPILYYIRGWSCRLLLYRVLLPAADHVFVQSEQMRRDVAAEGVPLEKMTAVPMGINPAVFLPASSAQSRRVIPCGARCFLYLGTLGRSRRIDFLLHVLARVHAVLPEVKLYLVGRGEDPSDERFLVSEAQRLSLRTSVVFVGHLPWEEALGYVREADVCVSPFYPTAALNSASPTKLVEYMAAGKAVVANDHPEQKLVIEESGGGCCVRWDEDAFAQAIIRLIQEPALARAMGERGRRYVERHRDYKMIADIVERRFLELTTGYDA